jgi:hypothetical protein
VLSIGYSEQPDEHWGKYEFYDLAATAHTPVIISSWLTNTTNATEPWGDGRLLCMRAENVTAGSRNATEIPSQGVNLQTQHLQLLGAFTLSVMAVFGGIVG